MDISSVKDLTVVISLITTGLAVTGILAAIAFFGVTIRRVLQILPAVMGLVVFVGALSIAVVRTQKPITYVTKATPEATVVVRTEVKRVDDGHVTVKVVLSNPAEVYLKYQGPGRDFIIPVTPDGGKSKNIFADFTIVKKDLTPGTAVIVVDGEDKGTLTIN